ncbi:MAG TPA: helicase HerA-like domain-containing protein, partial [Thermoanaerobaculia bacterium]|nr:helicase HerA-like domain-containing protein [Thermoanaerobaculia bacterium]
DASSALVEHIEQVARLIRSKGIGVFFITQTPKDVDEDVLAQLGNRVQHAIRAYTPKDAKNVKATASTFPESDHVDVQKSLTTLGIGEALVTVLDPKGVPTAVAATQILAPCSFMSSVDDAQYQRVISASPVATKYATPINRESAHEMLQKKLEQSAAAEPEPRDDFGWKQESDDFEWRNASKPASRKRASRPRQSAVERTVQTVARQATRTVTQQVVRGIFGMLKGKW